MRWQTVPRSNERYVYVFVLLAPKGTNITGKVTEVGDGLYNVEYTPTDIGSLRDLCIIIVD